jgi:hypothetical protein
MARIVPCPSSSLVGRTLGDTAEANIQTGPREDRVTILEYEHKPAEIDRLLNDPEMAIDPARVWALLAHIAQVPSAARALGKKEPSP